MIAADWFTAAAAAYRGAANLAGYLAGALPGRWVTARAPPARELRAMMLLAAATFIPCAFPLSFAWFFVWRFLAGWRPSQRPAVLRIYPAEIIPP